MKPSILSAVARDVIGAVLTFALPCIISVHAQAQATSSRASSHIAAQKVFATPQQAADALIASAGNYDVTRLLQILGPDGKDFVSSEDPVRDKQYAEAFAAKAREKSSVNVDPKNRTRAFLTVGDDDWP